MCCFSSSFCIRVVLLASCYCFFRVGVTIFFCVGVLFTSVVFFSHGCCSSCIGVDFFLHC